MSSNGYANAAQPMLSQLQGLANQAFNQQYNTYQAQQAQAALYSQHLAAGLARQQAHWMIDGVAMNFKEFVDTLCPEADDPMRTFLILKYKK